MGDRAENLNAAILKLKTMGEVASVSAFYETEPLEVTAQPWFLNCVVKLETEQTPTQLLASILGIEHQLGRQRDQHKGPRNIDIDTVLFGDAVVHAPGLTIPHPAMHERRFVLEPLAEIGPDVGHPAFKKTIQQLRDDLPEGQAVRKLRKP